MYLFLVELCCFRVQRFEEFWRVKALDGVRVMHYFFSIIGVVCQSEWVAPFGDEQIADRTLSLQANQATGMEGQGQGELSCKDTVSKRQQIFFIILFF